MASNINFTDIDENFPVAGQDNDSQGFRDNFSTIKTSLGSAKSEITALQDTTAKTNADNDFNQNIISNGVFRANSIEVFNTSQFSATGTVNWTDGNYQNVTVSGNTTITIDSFPDTGKYGMMRLAIRGSSDTSRTITFNSAESGVLRINPGWPTSNNTLVINSSSTPTIVDVFTTDAGQTVFLDYIGKFNSTTSGPDVIPLSSLSVTGTATVGGNTTINGSATIQGNLTVQGQIGQAITGTVDAISAIGDVNISSPAAGDILIYNDTTSSWDNSSSIVADNINITANDTTNETVHPVFVDATGGTSGIKNLETDVSLTYNPSTGTLTVGFLEGNFSGDVYSNSGSVKIVDSTNGKVTPNQFIIPSFTTSTRDSSGVAVDRSLIYNSTINQFQVYDPNQGGWMNLTLATP